MEKLSPWGERAHERIYRQLSEIFSQLIGDYTLPQEVEFVVESDRVYILQIRPAEHLLRDATFLIPVGFRNPEEVISFLQRQGEELGRRNWQVYRDISKKSYSDRTSSVAKGKAISRGAVKGSLCLSLAEAERVYALGGAPILLTTHRDEGVIEAMMKGKIAGIITTYGNEVMHEAVIAKMCMIPMAIINTGGPVNVGEREVYFGRRRLGEGDEIILFSGAIYEYSPEIELIDPYVVSSGTLGAILTLDFGDYSAEVRRDYTHLSVEEMMEEYAFLKKTLGEKIQQHSATDDMKIVGEVLLLNLRLHYLHRLILEKKVKGPPAPPGYAWFPTHDHGGEELFPIEKPSFLEEDEHGLLPIVPVVSEDGYERFRIGETTYEVELSDRIAREVAVRYDYQSTGIPRLGSEIVRATFYDSYANEHRYHGTLEHLSGRYFLSMTHRIRAWFYGSSEKEGVPAHVVEFFEFARRKLEGRGEEIYLRINQISVSGWTGHGGGMGGSVTFFGVDFPEAKLEEVKELLREWHSQKTK